MTSIEADIAIIGAGAAGATLAATLAEFTNKRIVLLERGGYFRHDYFNQREVDMSILYADRGRRTTIEGSIPVAGGECVGGSTTVNFALCFDPRQEMWDDWKHDVGAGPFSFDRSANDFGILGLNMAACLAEVRKRSNVHTPADSEINENNLAFAAGCKTLGISTKRHELNMIDCIGCGFCAQGCAYDRKLSTMVTYTRDALRRNVRLIHHCDVESIQFAQRGATRAPTGLTATVRSNAPGSEKNSVQPGPLALAAKLVIVSAGAIASPALLQRSRVPDPNQVIGRGLVLHPTLPIAGIFDRELTSSRGITEAVFSDHYYASHGFYYECLFGHPVATAAALPGFGTDHFSIMSQYAKLAGISAVLVDSTDPRNRVIWDDGRGAPEIIYHLSAQDKERLRFAAQRGVEIMLAAGAKQAVLPTEEPLGSLTSARFASRQDAAQCAHLRFRPCETSLFSAQCQSSVKMGEDPRRCAVNSRGESYAARNLIVCDASVFPTSCGVSPMISVMTLARYQGRRIANELARYGL